MALVTLSKREPPLVVLRGLPNAAFNHPNLPEEDRRDNDLQPTSLQPVEGSVFKGTEWSLAEEGKQWVEKNTNHVKKQRQQKISSHGDSDLSGTNTPEPGPPSLSSSLSPSSVGDFERHLKQLGDLHRFEVESLNARMKELEEQNSGLKKRVQQLKQEVRALRSENEQLQQQLDTVGLPEEPIGIVSGWKLEKDSEGYNSQLLNSKGWKDGTVRAIKYQHPLEADLMVSLTSKGNPRHHKAGLEMLVLSKDFSRLQRGSITALPLLATRASEGFRCVEGLVMTPQSS